MAVHDPNRSVQLTSRAALRLRAHRVVVELVALLAMPLAASAQDPATPCRYGQWSTPAPLAVTSDTTSAADTVNTYLRSPTIAMGAAAFVLGGSKGPHQAAGPASLLGADLREGKPLPPVPGEFGFYHPRAAVDVEGRLHVAWGEADTLNALSRSDQRITQVWYTNYTPTMGWLFPQHVMRTQWPLNESHLAVGPRGAVIYAGGTAFGIVLGVNRGAGWVVDTLRVWGTRPRLAFEDTTALLFFSGYGAREQPRNGIYVMRSADSGQTWSAPQLIREVNSSVSAHIEVTRSAHDGRLHLFWDARASTDRILDRLSLMHTYSSDAGLTWAAPEIVQMTSPFIDFKAVADGCGGLHVVTQHVQQRQLEVTASLSYLRRTDDGWSTPTRLFPGYVALDHDLASNGSSVILVFNGGHETNPDIAVGALIARLRTQ